ncbi:hypothetical protein [Nocardioides sp. CER19]|uniref:hypothetical protein n=1 Tax=Nocardioides sp. CER19 TaxID=3038538 RepID=UPI002446C68E|nr:hypothetical protein [Nocardioides sp. CER19]MDH2413241.1 hypothetical protein [Nocardioides sp. CER19]
MNRRLTAVAAAAAALVLLSSPAAVAKLTPTNPPPPGGGTVTPPPAGDGTLPTGGSTDDGGSGGGDGDVGGCHAVASPSFLGLACGGAAVDREKWLEKVLDGEKPPHCWDRAMTDDERRRMHVKNDVPTGAVWYWETCQEGIHDDYTIDPGGPRLTVTPRAHFPGDTWQTPTDNQQKVVDWLDNNAGVPTPIAGVSPSSHPRVGQWVSFFDGSDDEMTVAAGTVELRAHVTGLTVEPLAKGAGHTLTCAGSGHVATAGEKPPAGGGDCWFSYAHSSAAQPDGIYSVRITADWQVDAYVDGQPFRVPFATFSKSGITGVPVTEIQTVVVP